MMLSHDLNSVPGGPWQSAADGEGDPILDIALELGGSLEPRDVIERILETGLRAVTSDRATLSSLHNECLTIEATAGRNGSVTWVGRHYPLAMVLNQPAVAEAMLEKRPVLGGRLDVAAAANEFKDALAEVRHTATLPLVYRGDIGGLLVLSRYEDQPFHAKDLRNMAVLSAIAGLALRNARLYEAAQANSARLRWAVEAAEEVASELELSAVLARLLAHAVDAAGADNSSLATVEGGELVIQASTATDSAPGGRFPLAPSARRAVVRGHPIQMTAREYLRDHPETKAALGAHSRFLVVPLFVAGTGVGLLAISRVRDEAFSSDQMAAVQQFSPLAALLLRNARLLDEAKEANRTRDEFVNMAIHELRSPVSIIRGYVGMLEAGTITPADRPAEVLATISRSAEALNELVDELQLAARLGSRSVAVETQPLMAAAAARSAVARANPKAIIAGGVIGLDEGSDGVIVHADPHWLARILDNLINNALAYSPEAPDITVAVSEEEARVLFRVADHGIGIVESDQGRIFERFARASAARPGMGLGLYLSRGLAEMMQGSLSLVTSDVGAGSTFELALPRG